MVLYEGNEQGKGHAVIPFQANLWKYNYRRTSISGTKEAQITFPLRHFFPLKVVKSHGKVKSNSMENCPA
jgi:hypothetical protein